MRDKSLIRCFIKDKTSSCYFSRFGNLTINLFCAVSKKKRWLNEESDIIYQGVQRYGVGNWAKIAQLLHGRSNVDIKDTALSWLKGQVSIAETSPRFKVPKPRQWLPRPWSRYIKTASWQDTASRLNITASKGDCVMFLWWLLSSRVLISIIHSLLLTSMLWQTSSIFAIVLQCLQTQINLMTNTVKQYYWCPLSNLYCIIVYFGYKCGYCGHQWEMNH